MTPGADWRHQRDAVFFCAIGLEQIILRVSTSSSSAIRLYEHAGFKSCGIVPHALRLVDGPGQVRYFDKLTMVLML